MNTWNAVEGAPSPLGCTYISEEDSYNFAIYSKNAESITLLFYSDQSYHEPVWMKELDFLINKSQRIWHCRIKKSDLRGAIYYGYKIRGQRHIDGEPAYWQGFDPEKIILDPYAKEIFFPPEFSAEAACNPGSNAGKAPLGYINTDTVAFDWQNDKRIRHDDLIIYEMHVRGFTKMDESIAAEKRGTYAAVIEKIPYLSELGITAVELMPVHQFDMSGDSYWGYNTLNFFAPHQKYAYNKEPGGAITEFKTMVRELHKAGIEVILDVVYNHTTEGDINGPTYSFKGIDNSTYYLLNDHVENPYLNYSGTGNTMRTDHPVVQRLIVDSLIYWVKEMHVDGFRFDLASVFSITSEPTKSLPPIFSYLSADSDFRDVRLIAEPWHWGGYLLGRNFPGDTWAQWNDKFRDHVRKFVKGDAGMLGSVITRLYGSDDVFPDSLNGAYHPYQSVNFINCHDGFTLYDLISYNNRINSDGSSDNNSWNCGWEGDRNVPQEVLRLRMRQAKNFMVLLMLSNGTPMFCAGDEFLHTQHGHNNPYNLDNQTIWLDWTRLQLMEGNYTFVRQLIELRKNLRLGRSRYWRSDFSVYDENGQGLNFDDSDKRSFAFKLNQPAGGAAREIYVMLNFDWHSHQFKIPSGSPWKQLINTYLGPGLDIDLNDSARLTSDDYLVGERSVVVLCA